MTAPVSTAAWILLAQRDDGALPWYEGGHLDPWDHVEAAMALDAAGHHDAAEHAYRWLLDRQRQDGSWASRYVNGEPDDDLAEAHHTAYVAVGLRLHWLSTQDGAFRDESWPMVRRAIDGVLRDQAPGGEIWWAHRPGAAPDREALLTANCSIYQALRCALDTAADLGEAQPDWELALAQLDSALRTRPEAFADKRRYSMDWYYPVLGGVLRDEDGNGEARSHLAARWDEFVVPGHGVRCVSGRPWVTVAEACELALALAVSDRPDEARGLIDGVLPQRHDDASYWTGLVVDDGKFWPIERTTWTAAAVVLADAAVDATSPTYEVFAAPARRHLGSLAA